MPCSVWFVSRIHAVDIDNQEGCHVDHWRTCWKHYMVHTVA